MRLGLDSNPYYEDVNDVMSLLADEYRRHTIKYMAEKDKSEFRFDEIVGFLSDEFSEPVKKVRITMQHCHFPKLENHGLIEDYGGAAEDEVFHYSVSEIHLNDEDIMAVLDTLGVQLN